MSENTSLNICNGGMIVNLPLNYTSKENDQTGKKMVEKNL